MVVIYTQSYSETDRKEKNKTEHLLGRQLLLSGLKEQYQLEYTKEELEQALTLEENGKPLLSDHPEIHFNISHCEGLVACGFSDHPVGVDAELPESFRPAILRRLFTEEERAFFDKVADSEAKQQEWMYRFWTLKESFIKQSGLGLRRELNSFSFSFQGTGDPYVITCSEPGLYFSQQWHRDAYLVSVCTTQPEEILFIEK